MSVQMVDGVRLLKLRDPKPGNWAGAHPAGASDMMTLFYIWRLLSGGHALCDMTVFERKYL